jgi:hypothetical protein
VVADRFGIVVRRGHACGCARRRTPVASALADRLEEIVVAEREQLEQTAT